MSEYTEEQIEEIVQEAVAKTEKSFGGTFKRLKSENEELKLKYDETSTENEAARKEMEQRMKELESFLYESKKHISELAVTGEFQKQLREKGPLPERFVDVNSIEHSDDPEILKENVASAIEKGRDEFEKVLGEIGITLPEASQLPVNPTNPPSRDTKTAHDLKRAASKEVLHDMMSRGLIK